MRQLAQTGVLATALAMTACSSPFTMTVWSSHEGFGVAVQTADGAHGSIPGEGLGELTDEVTPRVGVPLRRNQ